MRQFLGGGARRESSERTTRVESADEHQEFRRDVEGLRAVAILLVVFYHVGLSAVSGGFVGVDVFFVISGFLITGQLVRELRARNRISFSGFYARRARRILPAAMLVVMVTAIVSAAVLNPLAAQRAEKDGLSAIYFGANFRFAVQGADYFNAGLSPSPYQHYWSLSDEEQFYVLWPLLLVICSLVWLRARRTRNASPVMPAVIGVLLAIFGVSLWEGIRLTATNQPWAYFTIFTRAWELALGALIALALPYIKRIDRRIAIPLTWIGLVCIAIAATSYSGSTAYPGYAALLPVLGAGAVIAGGSAASSRWGAKGVLGTPPFQRVGSWSYSWYLWHWPALVLVPAIVGHSLSKLEAVGVALLSLVIAVISFVLVERPIRRIKVIVKRPALGLAGGGLLAAIAVGVVALSNSTISLAAPNAPVARVLTPTTRTHTAPHAKTAQQLTATQLHTDLAAGANTTAAPSNLTPALSVATKALPVIVTNGCHLQHPGVWRKPCIYGDTTSSTSVVLFGDSHAAAWFPALNTISQQQHWRLIDVTKAGCPAAETNIDYAGSIYTNCTIWRQNAERYIANLHPALVIVTWARYIGEPEARPLSGVPTGYGSIWQDGVAAIFRFLHHNASHVLFISDGPTLGPWAPDCISGHLSDVRPCMSSLGAATRLPEVKAQELALAKREQISSVDPTPWFCTPSVCPVIVGNILLYRDNEHMTPQWSKFIAPVVSNYVVAAMKSTD